MSEAKDSSMTMKTLKGMIDVGSLRLIADNLEKFWLPLANRAKAGDFTRQATSDAADLRRIANEMEKADALPMRWPSQTVHWSALSADVQKEVTNGDYVLVAGIQHMVVGAPPKDTPFMMIDGNVCMVDAPADQRPDFMRQFDDLGPLSGVPAMTSRED